MELKEDVISFPESSLALPGWPKVWPKHHRSTDANEDESKRAMHILFALLYGAKLDCEQICGCYYKPSEDIAREILSKAVITCAYAEYWGCLDLIGPRLLTVLHSDPDFWKKVSDFPEIYLALAVKLEDAKFYFCALRHGILSACESGEWESLAEVSDLDITDLRAFYEPHLAAQHKEVEPKFETIVGNLRKLQLQSMRAKHYGGGWHDAKTRSLDTLPFIPEDRSEDTKAFESVDYLARAIYGEYLVYKLDGEAVVDSPMGGPRVYIKRYVPTIPHNIRISINTDIDYRDPSASLVQDIVEAAEQQDPSHLFDAAAGVRFASMYNFTAQQRHQLHLRLRFLVREANDFIKAAFPIKTLQGMFGGKLTKCVLTRAYLGDCYTYMAVPDHVPWEQHKELASSDKDKAIVPGIGVADASPERISTLTEHFGGNVEENKVDEDEVEVVGANWEAGFEAGSGAEVEGLDW